MSSQQIQKYTHTTQVEKMTVHITMQYESMQKQFQQYWNSYAHTVTTKH
jgi:hypothetical protein